jgi:hypothetical protein
MPSKSNALMIISSTFRDDMTHFFPEHQNLVVLELGKYLGYTTRFFSLNFRRVYSIEVNRYYDLFSKIYNSDRNNISNLVFDLYQGDWKKLKDFCPNPDIVFVDAAHDAKSVEMDIQNCLIYYPKSTLIFDDYGSWEGVYQSVNKFIDNRQLKLISTIGCAQNSLATPDGNFTNKLGAEGIICKSS